MRTLILALLLATTAQAATKAEDARARDLGYTEASDIIFMACDDGKEYLYARKICDSIVAQMKSGHLVRESDYQSWCGVAKGYSQKLDKYEAQYKKVYGRKINYKECHLGQN